MTFEKWLTGQAIRDDAIGDLAKDYIDEEKVRNLSYEYLAEINAAYSVFDVLSAARKEYAGLYLIEK